MHHHWDNFKHHLWHPSQKPCPLRNTEVAIYQLMHHRLLLTIPDSEVKTVPRGSFVSWVGRSLYTRHALTMPHSM